MPLSGSAIVLPSSTLTRVAMIASSTIALPDVRAVISSPSRIGTPEETSVLSVRQKRATAIFFNTVCRAPGILSISRRGAVALCRSCDSGASRKIVEPMLRKHQPPPGSDEVGQRDRDPRRQRQAGAQPLEQRGERRNDLPQDDPDHQHGDQITATG